MNNKWQSFKTSLWLFFDAIRAGISDARGSYRIEQLPQPVITIFGGSRANLSDPIAKQAYDMARLLAQNNMSVLNGGGPGIMEAASCGASSVCKDKGIDCVHTLGIAVHGIDEEFENPCAELFKVRHFFVRKNLLIRYSMGYIVFPGGIGTMDELSDLLNLLKHHRIPPLPVVLIGVDYWKPFIDWYTSALTQNFIKEECSELFIVTDDLQVALKHVQGYRKHLR